MVYISSWTARPIFVFVIHISTSFASTCYFPDGTIASDSPCTNSTTSACCAADAYCLDNGLCLTDMVLSRGSCTDQTWKASECASYCQTVNPSGGKGMAPCSSTLWTCDYGTCAQDNFTVPDGNLVLRNYQASSLGVSVAAATVTIVPTMVGSSLLPLSTTTSVNPGQSSAATSTNIGGGQTGSAACDSSSTSKASNSTIIAVGVGIGAPLGIALAALLLMFCRERKRNARLQQSQSQNSRIEGENLIRNNTRNTMRWEMDGPGQKGKRTTLAELRGDMMGSELPEGNLQELR